MVSDEVFQKEMRMLANQLTTAILAAALIQTRGEKDPDRVDDNVRAVQRAFQKHKEGR